MEGVWLLGVVIFWAHGSLAAEPSGSEILKRSQAAYAALKSYVGTTTVKTQAVVDDMSLAQTATARIMFTRPGKIRIEGKDTGGQLFTIVSDGSDAWLSWAVKSKGAFEKATNLETAIAAMTGVAAASPTTIPAALMALRWGSPWAGAAAAKLEGREKIGGVECYRTVTDTPIGRTTYWVDTKSFLLRQMREEQDEEALAQMQRSIGEDATKALREKGVEPPKFTMKSRRAVYAFQIDKVDAPIPQKLFQDPTKIKSP